MTGDDPILSVRRISVVGSSGSGKTWLARDLCQVLGLPLVELDLIRKEERRGHAPGEGFVQRVKRHVSEPGWVIDGHYREVRHTIWMRADCIVYLDYPLTLVAARLCSRFFEKRRTASPSLAHGTQDNGQLATASWRRRGARIWKTMRERGEYRSLLRGPDYAHLQVIHLTSPEETRLWLESLQRSLPATGSGQGA